MRKASTVLLEQGTQTPSPAPDLIPAERLTENLHRDWYRKRGHFSLTEFGDRWVQSIQQLQQIVPPPARPRG
jgi:hypothetical protein